LPDNGIEYTPESEARLLKAYEVVTAHFRQDVLLYWTRMSVFLVVQVALLAVVNSLYGKDDRAIWIFAIVGAGTSLIWFLVARASLRWIQTWRQKVAEIDAIINPLASYGVETVPSTVSFSRVISRPSEIASALPILFLCGWIALVSL
jgi:hypothetical protein